MPRLTVSLCIPTHGRPRFLREALDSGLAQTRLPDEILVSDDLGTEETREMVTRLALSVQIPLRYVLCKMGGSQAANINHLFQEATGQLILLLHDDDLLLPGAVEMLAPPLEENPDVIGVFGKQMVMTDGGEDRPAEAEGLNRDFYRTSAFAGLQPDALVSGIRQQFPNDGYLVRSSVARELGMRAETGAGCDFDFGIRMGRRGSFYFVDAYTSKYRMSAESVGRGAGGLGDNCAYHAMFFLAEVRKTDPYLEAEVIEKLKGQAPIAIAMATRMGKLQEAWDWYRGPYHRDRILTLGGIRRGLELFRAWL